MTLMQVMLGARSLVPSGVVLDGLQTYLTTTVSASYPGTGTTWFDISGNNRNFTWTTTPTYITGTPNYFSTSGKTANGPAANSFGITDNYTIVIVALQNTLTQNFAFYFPSTTAGDPASRGITGHWAWTDGVVYWDQGGCCAASQRTNVASGGTNTWNIWTISRVSSTSRTIYKNGTALTTNTSAAVSPGLGSSAAFINDIVTAGYGPNGWDARIGGFFVYNRGLNSTEVTQNYNAIKASYGIA